MLLEEGVGVLEVAAGAGVAGFSSFSGVMVDVDVDREKLARGPRWVSFSFLVSFHVDMIANDVPRLDVGEDGNGKEERENRQIGRRKERRGELSSVWYRGSRRRRSGYAVEPDESCCRGEQMRRPRGWR